MPTKNKILLTLLVILISVFTVVFEYINSNIINTWIIIIIMILMIVGLWIFPEAKGKIEK